ncbi:MAG: hypothetical protein RSC43_00450 [Clostridia bacterium]
MKVTYLYAADNMESMYAEYNKTKPCTRYQYLIHMTAAADRTTGVVTSESIKNMPILTSKIAKWASLQNNLESKDIESIDSFISLISLAYDIFDGMLERETVIEEIFSDEVAAASFSEVRSQLEKLRGIISAGIYMSKLESQQSLANNGNVFQCCRYENGELKYYEASGLVGNTSVCQQSSIYFANSFADFVKLIQWHMNLLKVNVAFEALVTPRIAGLNAITENCSNGPCAVIFTDGGKQPKFPYRLGGITPNAKLGFSTSSFLDKVSGKRVGVYII